MSIYKTNFTFTSTPYASPVIMEFPIGDNITARLETVDPSVACLYFVREQAEVAIPSGMEVFDETNRLYVKPFLEKNYFILCWTENYSIHQDKKQLLYLSNKRSWAVHGDPKIPVTIMDT